MMPWNRKELWMGSSMKKFSDIRRILDANEITYNDKVKSAGWSGGRGLGERSAAAMRAGENAESLNLYYIYVHKYEYERASHLIWEVVK